MRAMSELDRWGVALILWGTVSMVFIIKGLAEIRDAIRKEDDHES